MKTRLGFVGNSSTCSFVISARHYSQYSPKQYEYTREDIVSVLNLVIRFYNSINVDEMGHLFDWKSDVKGNNILVKSRGWYDGGKAFIISREHIPNILMDFIRNYFTVFREDINEW